MMPTLYELEVVDENDEQPHRGNSDIDSRKPIEQFLKQGELEKDDRQKLPHNDSRYDATGSQKYRSAQKNVIPIVGRATCETSNQRQHDEMCIRDSSYPE